MKKFWDVVFWVLLPSVAFAIYVYKKDRSKFAAAGVIVSLTPLAIMLQLFVCLLVVSAYYLADNSSLYCDAVSHMNRGEYTEALRNFENYTFFTLPSKRDSANYISAQKHIKQLKLLAAKEEQRKQRIKAEEQRRAHQEKLWQQTEQRHAEIAQYLVDYNHNCEQYKHAFQIADSHPQWDTYTCCCIAFKTLRIGMTKEQVIMSIGKPDDINRTVTENSVSEQWCYGVGLYLYFDSSHGDTLEAYQN
jgi:hypothetical protein